jgi:two-component system catabolic regulation response regulator CreB
MTGSLLLVEDDPAIGRTAAYALERDGLRVEHVLLLQAARQRLREQPLPAAVILDIGLPDGSGLALCGELRRAADPALARLPLLMLSARAEEVDRVLGLELGADDYLAKPFSPRELCARVRALLRRSAAVPPAAPAPTLSCDAEGSRARIGDVWLKLTRRELGLLQWLLRHPGRVWTREALLQAVWGHDAESADRTVDTHIKTLRAKLREARPDLDLIVTHRGLGYSLDLPR